MPPLCESTPDRWRQLFLTPLATFILAGLACGHIEQGRDWLQCARSHAFAAFRNMALGERGTWRLWERSVQYCQILR